MSLLPPELIVPLGVRRRGYILLLAIEIAYKDGIISLVLNLMRFSISRFALITNRALPYLYLAWEPLVNNTRAFFGMWVFSWTRWMLVVSPKIKKNTYFIFFPPRVGGWYNTNGFWDCVMATLVHGAFLAFLSISVIVPSLNSKTRRPLEFVWDRRLGSEGMFLFALKRLVVAIRCAAQS